MSSVCLLKQFLCSSSREGTVAKNVLVVPGIAAVWCALQVAVAWSLQFDYRL